MVRIEVRALTADDRRWVEAYIRAHWGDTIVVAHGEVYHPQELPGFVALLDAAPAGLLTYHIGGSGCEIVTLDSDREGQGVGTALIAAARDAARAAGCARLWLITTNDNLNALRFYQKRGFALRAVHPGAVDAARRIKPAIPLIGEHGIPLRDELELELTL